LVFIKTPLFGFYSIPYASWDESKESVKLSTRWTGRAPVLPGTIGGGSQDMIMLEGRSFERPPARIREPYMRRN